MTLGFVLPQVVSGDVTVTITGTVRPPDGAGGGEPDSDNGPGTVPTAHNWSNDWYFPSLFWTADGFTASEFLDPDNHTPVTGTNPFTMYCQFGTRLGAAPDYTQYDEAVVQAASPGVPQNITPSATVQQFYNDGTPPTFHDVTAMTGIVTHFDVYQYPVKGTASQINEGQAATYNSVAGYKFGYTDADGTFHPGYTTDINADSGQSNGWTCTVNILDPDNPLSAQNATAQIVPDDVGDFTTALTITTNKTAHPQQLYFTYNASGFSHNNIGVYSLVLSVPAVKRPLKAGTHTKRAHFS